MPFPQGQQSQGIHKKVCMLRLLAQTATQSKCMLAKVCHKGIQVLQAVVQQYGGAVASYSSSFFLVLVRSAASHISALQDKTCTACISSCVTTGQLSSYMQKAASTCKHSACLRPSSQPALTPRLPSVPDLLLPCEGQVSNILTCSL